MNQEAGQLAIVILAAGSASRFGSPKQLAMLNGKNLLQHTLESARVLAPESTYIVLGAHADEIKASGSFEKNNIIMNTDWATGMASSIVAGIHALPNHYHAVMIILADQASLDSDKLEQMTASWRQQPDKIIAAAYADTVGVPAIFPATYFSALLKLKGDVGAKQIIQTHYDDVLTIPMSEAGSDIDTIKDLKTVL